MAKNLKHAKREPKLTPAQRKHLIDAYQRTRYWSLQSNTHRGRYAPELAERILDTRSAAALFKRGLAFSLGGGDVDVWSAPGFVDRQHFSEGYAISKAGYELAEKLVNQKKKEDRKQAHTSSQAKALAAKYKASFATSAFPMSIEGVEVVVYSMPYRGKEGGKYRGWFVHRADNQRAIVEYAPTKEAAIWNASANIRYFGVGLRS
jgi:hypothetical protein